MERSIELAKDHKFVVICDISEFYSRIGHHRLENALAHLRIDDAVARRIREFLSNFSGTNSFGLPVGGPAARLLSELTLNQVDQLLALEGVQFCRFSDDFHFFANSTEEAFDRLLLVTNKLQRTQGLQLQKAKTRILSSAEFISTSPIRSDDHDAPLTARTKEIQEKSRDLLRFSLRFDPYSPTAHSDYENLKKEIENFDIIKLLQSELSKSRIHIALAKKIVATIKYLDPPLKEQAIISIFENVDILYPIFGGILLMLRQVFDDVSEQTRLLIVGRIIDLIRTNSHVLRVELNLAYAIRTLACHPSARGQEVLARLYTNSDYTSLIRRDIILAMAKWRVWHWLSERRASFRAMSPPERRAFLIASYVLRDEGKHWRRHLSAEFSPFEKLVRTWASNRMGQPNWVIPL